MSVMTQKSSVELGDGKDQFGIGRRIWIATAVVGLLTLGVGGWGVMAELSSAIIAPGTVVLDRNVRKVQHREGGIVADILVREGQAVKAGQRLILLDESQTRAELGIVRGQLIEMTGRKSRLMAERDGLDAIEFPSDFTDMGGEAEAVRRGEVRLFVEAQKTRESQREQLRSRIEQMGNEVKGMSKQRDAKEKELSIISKELAHVADLQRRQLTPVSRVYAMERESTRLDGDHGNFVSQIARVTGQVSELNLQILAIDQNARTEAQREMRNVEARLGELSERQTAIADRLTRMELKAPQSGIVQDMTVHTVGGVITPAEPVMVIVPDNEILAIEVRIAPNDIDQITLGQKARLRFTAFNQRTTPELPGHVIHVAGSATFDGKSGQSYFMARIAVDASEKGKLAALKLVPGMPVEAYVSTGDRTAFAYLTKPLVDQFARAFKEE